MQPPQKPPFRSRLHFANPTLQCTRLCCCWCTLCTYRTGFAFFAPLQAFAKVSAKLNPAMCLAQWVWGNITGVDFVCLSLAELAGAFVGE